MKIRPTTWGPSSARLPARAPPTPDSRPLPSLASLLSRYSPRHSKGGGVAPHIRDPAIWAKRPMTVEMVIYAANDVQGLFEVRLYSGSGP